MLIFQFSIFIFSLLTKDGTLQKGLYYYCPPDLLSFCFFLFTSTHQNLFLKILNNAVTGASHFSLPFIFPSCGRAVRNAVYTSQLPTLEVFYTCALKLNVTCKKGQKGPNVAILVGNSADVACGVRKGLVRSAVLWTRPTHSQATAAAFSK